MAFTAFENPVTEKLIAKGAKNVDGYDLPVIQRTVTDDYESTVILSAYMGNDEISVSLAAADEPDIDDAKKLFDNVLARLEREGNLHAPLSHGCSRHRAWHTSA